jgi:hypothetical protein
MYEENKSITKAALSIIPSNDSRLCTLQFYGTEADPLISMSQLLDILGDVSEVEALECLGSNDYITGQLSDGKPHVLLRTIGIYTILFRSKSEVGVFFKTFIRNLLDKLRKEHPSILIDTYNKTLEEFARLRIKYNEKVRLIGTQSEQIANLQMTTDEQERKRGIYVETINKLQLSGRQIDDDSVDQAKRSKRLLELATIPLYIYLVPIPRKLKSIIEDMSDVSSVDSYDPTLYAEDVPPEEEIVMYYMISKSSNAKKTLVCIERMFRDTLTVILEELKCFKVGKNTYKCRLADIHEAAQLAVTRYLDSPPPPMKPRKKVSESSDSSDSDDAKIVKRKTTKSKPKSDGRYRPVYHDHTADFE